MSHSTLTTAGVSKSYTLDAGANGQQVLQTDGINIRGVWPCQVRHSWWAVAGAALSCLCRWRRRKGVLRASRFIPGTACWVHLNSSQGCLLPYHPASGHWPALVPHLATCPSCPQ